MDILLFYILLASISFGLMISIILCYAISSRIRQRREQNNIPIDEQIGMNYLPNSISDYTRINIE